MKIYLSGPITGIPNYKDKFQTAEESMKKKFPNATIINPTIIPEGLDYKDYMRIDMTLVSVCDMIVMLPGWSYSKGARAELAYAESLGLDVTYICEV